MNKNLLRLFPVALGLLATTSYGGVISDITITNNGFVSPLKPGYSLFEALNFQGTSLTRNGISFTGESMTDGVDNTLGISSLVTINGGALATADIGSVTDPLFFTETYNNGGTGLKLTLSNLDPTKTYFFEVYHGEPRTCCSGFFNQDSFIDGATSYPIPGYQLGNSLVDSPPAPNDRWTISGTVSGVSTFQYQSLNVPGRGSSIMGYQLQAVPEPTSAALLLAGGMIALRRRRQIG